MQNDFVAPVPTPVANPAVSVVITAHSEGLLLHRAVMSATAALERLTNEAGASGELIVVLDRPDDPTERLGTRLSGAGHHVTHLDLGDPGQARNHGIERSRGEYVALLDGDDLLSEAWLTKGHALFVRSGLLKTVLRPEVIVVFGTQNELMWQVSATSQHFRASGLMERNGWALHLMAPRELLTALPFRSMPARQAFHEDWTWNCDVLAGGGTVEVVPGTCGYYRARRESLSADRGPALPAPTKLFGPGMHLDRDPPSERQDVTTDHRNHQSITTMRRRLEASGRRVVLRHPELAPLALGVRRGLLTVDRFIARRRLPLWLRHDLMRAHLIEPSLFPNSRVASSPQYVALPASPLGETVGQLLAATPSDVTHILIAPWVKRGGSDLELLNYARALRALGARPVVMTTEDTESPWRTRLPSDVALLEFGSVARRLNTRQQERALALYLVQSRARVAHVFNSGMAYGAIAEYGVALSSTMSLVASVFCEDRTREGEITGHIVSGLPEVEPYLTAVFSDGRKTLSMLQRLFGIEESRLHVHYQPIDAAPPRPAAQLPESRRLRVLWAGRLDRQKRPDLLVAVARACKGLAIEFTAYGYGLLDPAATRNEMRRAGIRFRGAYNEFSDLNPPEFDVFLNTSEWDGLPNVVLEAAAAGLAIVSSDSGAIPEFVRGGESGLLVSPYDDVDQYTQALARVLDQPQLIDELRRGAYRRLATQHSWTGFLEEVKGVPGYVRGAADPGEEDE